MAAPEVFISMGNPYTDAYKRFRNELEDFLQDQCKVEPKIMNKNVYPPGNPLVTIKNVMEKCSGALVVAYERSYVRDGKERRTSRNPPPRNLINLTYTTPWNHVESAMAFCLGVPLYIICQKGLVEEGLIENKFDWNVQYLDIVPGAFENTDVTRPIQAWIESSVLPRSKDLNGSNIVRTITGERTFMDIKNMTPKDVLAVSGVLSGAFAFGVATGATTRRSLIDPVIGMFRRPSKSDADAKKTRAEADS